MHTPKTPEQLMAGILKAQELTRELEETLEMLNGAEIQEEDIDTQDFREAWRGLDDALTDLTMCDLFPS